MSEERIAKIINSRVYPATSITIVSWTLALYWISVSGLIMFIPKMILLLMPVILTAIEIIARIIKTNKNKKRVREEILLRAYLRRLNEELI